MARDNKAYNALIKARTVLLVQQPFFGCLALQMNVVEVTNPFLCNTMAVDGTNMYYFPPFVLSLTEDELKGVVAHEVLHCAYKHMTRRGHRDPRKWNIAADFVINADLIKAGFTLPGKPRGLNTQLPPGTKGYLLDLQFAGLSTEAVYARLPDPPVITITISMGGDGEGNGKDGSGMTVRCQDDGGCGGVIDASAGGDEAKKDKVDRDWDTNVRIAVSVAKSQNAGSVPEYLQRLVEDLKKPTVSWRDLTRQFIDGAMSSDYAWSRPNRRFVSSGLVLPGFIPDTLHKMVFLGDVSGSISPQVMRSFVSEISGALDDGVADQVVVAYFDTEIKSVDEYVPGDVIKCDTRGGGGTDFRPALDWVAKDHDDASCVVVLTDMQPNSWDLPVIDAPLMWGAYCPRDWLAQIKPPYGETVWIEDL